MADLRAHKPCKTLVAGPPLWPFGPILNAYIGSYDLKGHGKKIMIFIPKLHILATRVKKSIILTIFGPYLAILEDFLTKKKNKTWKLHIILEEVGKLFYFMTYIPKFHILAFLENFLTEEEKNGKTKKLHLVLEDMVRFFYFKICISKFHILANRGKKKLNFDHFCTILTILEDFLAEMEKNE